MSQSNTMPDTGGDRTCREYVALDPETTGLMAGTDRIVDIGAVRLRDSGFVVSAENGAGQ